MALTILKLVSLLELVAATTVAAQNGRALQDLAGSWALDRAASTFGQGDPGAERVDIRLAANQVIVTRRFSGLPEPSVWTLPLDGSAPARPARGSAVVTNGRLVITHERAWEIVTHVYNVEGDTLRVERSIRPKSADGNAQPVTHVMVYGRVE